MPTNRPGDQKKEKAGRQGMARQVRLRREEDGFTSFPDRYGDGDEALRWEMEMAKKYLDVAGVVIVALNKKGKVTLINKKGCEILGWRERDMIGKDWFDHFVPLDIRDEVREVFSRLMEGQVELLGHYDNPVLTKRGERKTIAWYNSVLCNDSGEIIGILSSGEDITERKQAEDALRESEKRYKMLVQTFPDAVTVTDLEGNITYVSRQTIELHGFVELSEMLGKRAFDLIAPEYRAKAVLNFKRTIREGVVQSIEYELLRKDGTRFAGEQSSAVIHDKSGNPNLLIISTRDMTQRKKVEEELKRSVKEKELLLQEIHHRVKNNLQVISSLLDLSQLRIHDRMASGLIQDARSKIQTMAFIHSQLYKSDRFDRIEMGAHVRELIHYLSSVYAPDKNIDTFVDIPAIHLPLTQAIPCALVVNELISNAFKHAFRKQKKGNIEISMNISGGDRIFIKIKDDGKGLRRDTDIFETESLGLKLVRKIVEKQLKGKIKLTRNKTTEFFIEFRKAAGEEV